MPKLRTTERSERLKELSTILKMFGFELQAIHTRSNPVNGMTGGWRAYPYRLAIYVEQASGNGMFWFSKRGFMFGTLQELEQCVHQITQGAVNDD